MNIKKSIRVASAMKETDTKWLAEQLGVSTARINLMKNQEQVNTTTLDRLAEAFDMKPSEFVALGE